VVGEICVHDYHVVAGRELETVDVGCSKTEFAGAGFQEDVRRVRFGELVGYDLGAVRGAIVAMMSSQSSFCSVNVRLKVMMGRLRRSL